MPPFQSAGSAHDRPAQSKRRRSYGRIIAIVIPLLAATLIAETLTLQLAQLVQVQASGPVLVRGTLTPLLAHSRLKGPADPQRRIALSIGLRPRNQGALSSYVQDISRAHTINYHRFLTPAQYSAVFSPDVASYDALRQFLQASGFTITHTYRHRLLIAFSGTIARVEQVFHVTINTYTAPNGRLYYANAQDPQVPVQFAAAVQSISGLNDAARWQHQPLPEHPLVQKLLRPQVSACPPHGSGYYTPDQLAGAYNLQGLYAAGDQGQGQTVALFELNTFSASDLATYAACFGHSHTPIQVIPTGSSPVVTDSGAVETQLDAELLLSAAPQLGMLKVYETANDAADIMAQWAQIVQDATPVVSSSWGICEQFADSSMVTQENTLFTTAAAQGQSIIAASGDSGSAGCMFDDISHPSVLSASDPSSQPFVTGVGGTSLTIAGTASYGSETAWNTQPNAANNGGASNGGISLYWSSPSWQNAPGVSSSYSSGQLCNAPAGSICRETPDVSLNADPNKGYMMYCTLAVAGCSSSQPWIIAGGTSAAAPMWAAFTALANALSLRQGYFNLGFLNPLLYQIARNPAEYAADFHDVTTGNNDFSGVNHGLYPATRGYDMATGLGSYNAYALANTLVTLAHQTTGARAAPANSTWYFAEGSVGGGFQEYLTLENTSSTQDATVAITYLFQSRAPLTVHHVVSKSARITVSVNADLQMGVNDPQQAISAIVSVMNNGPGIVAERPMYFNYRGISSGTDVVGTTRPATTYYFPDADTRQVGRNYYSYITMLNPSSTQSATATLTYYTGACGLSGQAACPAQTIVIPPLHRGTGSPLALSLYQRVAVRVQSTQPIVAERPMYLRDTIPGAGGLTTGAASEAGAAAPGNDWLFAEGYTGFHFQEVLILANFATTGTTAHITLEYDNGHTQTQAVSVPALGQYIFDVNQANAAPSGACDTSPCQVSMTAAAEVTSAAPIVADRLMYFHYGSQDYTGATETIGEAGPASHSVYSFAEGYTGSSFQEYLTLQNPTAQSEAVVLTLYADSSVTQQQVSIGPHSRQTVNINTWLVPIVRANIVAGIDPYAVSISVQALGVGARIIAERPMYFDYHGDQGGSDAIGYAG